MARLDLKIFFLFNFLYLVQCGDIYNSIDSNTEFDLKVFVFWPNGTIPFFINQDHFDSEQSMTIMRGLSLFAFKTCLKFLPVMVSPTDNQHVLTFENPGGTRKCDLARHGHVRDGPHRILLGYECLRTPMLERVIMRALGFPFEHNRISRDGFLDVQLENIEQSAMELFAKDFKLPEPLRNLEYDVNSVMHFDDRDYSKNGHRTFLFKDRKTKQVQTGLSETDLKKIDLVYGPECRTRDREEKFELCQQYPGGEIKRRKKRDLDDSTKSLRVNPDITPPPEVVAAGSRNLTSNVSESLVTLGVANEVEEIVENIYKLSAKALQNARNKYCNESNSKDVLRAGDRNTTDILGVIKLITNYVRSMVDSAVENLPMFCEEALSVDKYQRFGCHGYQPVHCKESYKSTKSGAVTHSTQHRPIVIQSTKHHGAAHFRPHVEPLRNSNHSETETETGGKDVEKIDVVIDVKEQEHVANESRQDAVNEEVTLSLSHGTRAPDRLLGARSKREASVVRRKGEDSSNIDHSRSEEGSGKSKSKGKKSRVMANTVILSKENEEFYSERRWPHRVVHYMIDKNAGKFDINDVRARLDEVNRILREKTCVHIKEIKKKDAEKYEDYLIIDNSPDYVTGRVGGKQFFGSSELLKGGQHRQHTAMMVMAMLGFYFEVSRHDRDKYIRVHNRHIRADKLHHFEQIRSDATLSIPYDYKSATHPAWQFWRKVGKTGISTVATFKDRDPDGSVMKSLGQNEELLSDGDITKINSVYGIECMIKGERSKEMSKESDDKSREKKQKITEKDEISD